MKKFFSTLRKDSVAVWSFWICSILTLAIVGIVLMQLHNLPLFIPIYNKLPWGYARLGTRLEIFVPISLEATLVILNTILGVHFAERIPLLSRFLFLTNISMSVFLAIFVIKVLQLVL